MWPLLLTLPAAAVLWLLFTEWEIGYNARRIKADGAANSLRFWFHFRRFCIRAAVAGVLAGAAAYPAAHGYGWLVAGQVAGFAGWFLFRFTPALNLRRGKAKYYVSASSTTAWLDRTLWARAIAAVPHGVWNDAELWNERNRYASNELRRLLLAGLLAGGAVYAGCLLLVLL